MSAESNDPFELHIGDVVLSRHIVRDYYNRDGKRVVQSNHRLKKNKKNEVFVSVVLGVREVGDVTPEWVTEQLELMLQNGFGENNHGEN